MAPKQPVFCRETTLCSHLPAVQVLPPERLPFVIPDGVLSSIETAQQNLDMLVDDLQMSCFTFIGYGKDFIKTQRLSPDSFIQMAIQLAFYRLVQYSKPLTNGILFDLVWKLQFFEPAAHQNSL